MFERLTLVGIYIGAWSGFILASLASALLLALPVIDALYYWRLYAGVVLWICLGWLVLTVVVRGWRYVLAIVLTLIVVLVMFLPPFGWITGPLFLVVILFAPFALLGYWLQRRKTRQKAPGSIGLLSGIVTLLPAEKRVLRLAGGLSCAVTLLCLLAYGFDYTASVRDGMAEPPPGVEVSK